MGHLPVGEHLPHQHAESPDIRLGGEVTLQDGLRGHPAQGHPGLAEVVVLTAEQKDTEAVGWGEGQSLGPQPHPKGLGLTPGLEPKFSVSRHSGKLETFLFSKG